jgi:hypothetical protein
MTSMPETTDPVAAVPAVAADDGPRLYGVVDVLRADRVAGWAIDRADSRAALEVEIRREGRVVATVRADRTRKDLERGGVGTGRYGFVCDLAPPLDPGFEFTVSAVARTADGAATELRRVGASAAAPERRVLERIYEELCRRRAAREPDAQDALGPLIGRLEVVQARIEAALDAVEPPAAPPMIGLRILLGVSLAVGVGSLALGLWSMWQP